MKTILNLIYMACFLLISSFSNETEIIPSNQECITKADKKVISDITEIKPYKALFDFDIIEINREYEIDKYKQHEKENFPWDYGKKGEGPKLTKKNFAKDIDGNGHSGC